MKNESSVRFAKFEKKKLTLSKFHEKYHRRPRGFEDSDLDERKDSKEYMKSYPSLPYGTECHLPIVAFDKLDGSNVRAEWTSKKVGLSLELEIVLLTRLIRFLDKFRKLLKQNLGKVCMKLY